MSTAPAELCREVDEREDELHGPLGRGLTDAARAEAELAEGAS